MLSRREMLLAGLAQGLAAATSSADALALEKVRQARKPCLIFKVYGASRKCASSDQMREALRLVSRHAKPTDCVVIGMFPKHQEQVQENARLVAAAFTAAT